MVGCVRRREVLKVKVVVATRIVDPLVGRRKMGDGAGSEKITR